MPDRLLKKLSLTRGRICLKEMRKVIMIKQLQKITEYLTNQTIISWKKLRKLQLEHAWLEAWLPGVISVVTVVFRERRQKSMDFSASRTKAFVQNTFNDWFANEDSSKFQDGTDLSDIKIQDHCMRNRQLICIITYARKKK